MTNIILLYKLINLIYIYNIFVLLFIYSQFIKGKNNVNKINLQIKE